MSRGGLTAQPLLGHVLRHQHRRGLQVIASVNGYPPYPRYLRPPSLMPKGGPGPTREGRLRRPGALTRGFWGYLSDGRREQAKKWPEVAKNGEQAKKWPRVGPGTLESGFLACSRRLASSGRATLEIPAGGAPGPPRATLEWVHINSYDSTAWVAQPRTSSAGKAIIATVSVHGMGCGWAAD